MLRFGQEPVHEALQVGEVGPVAREEGGLVGPIRARNPLQKRIGGSRDLLGIDQLLGQLVEVGANALDRGPACLPLAQVEVILRRPDDLLEVIEDEQKLGQIVERLEVVPQFGAVPVLGEDLAAETVDRRDA